MPRTRSAGSKRARTEEPEPATLAQKLRRKMSVTAAVEDRGAPMEHKTSSKKVKRQGTEAKAPKNALASSQTGPALSDFHCDFSKRKSVPQIPVSSLFMGMQRSLSFIHFQYQTALGLHASFNNRQSLKDPVVQDIESWTCTRVLNNFDRRTTALEWHPTQPNLLVAASKAGDMLLWDVNELGHRKKEEGIGPGGSISAIKFHPHDSSLMFITSLDGRTALYSFENLTPTMNILQTNDWTHWFTSLDVSGRNKALVAGDNTGHVHMKNFQWETVFHKKLHKNKVTHAEFSPREDWHLCTASVDHTVKMWDIRNIKDKKSYLACLQHDFGINSAHFSATDGCRLLTTDQHSELRLYKAPDWHLERCIPHPHRFFQHLTPIKATWHPLQDLIVVGRYPDPAFPGSLWVEKKCIDIIDADTGSIDTQITSPEFDKISSVNKFSPAGDMLASGMAQMVVVRRKPNLDSHFESEVHVDDLDVVKGRHLTDLRPSGSRRGRGRSRGSTSQKEKTPRTKMNPSKAK